MTSRHGTRGPSTTSRTGDLASPPAPRTACSSAPVASRGCGSALPFGAAVWASGYVVLPLLGVYKPIWKYDFETLRKDLSAHLVFGTTTAATFALLTNAVPTNHRSSQ